MSRFVGFALGIMAVVVFSYPVLAEDMPPGDYGQALEATAESDQDYQELKSRLLKRYDSLTQQLQQAETSFTSQFPDVGGAGSLPDGFTPWWQPEVSGHLNPSVATSETDVTELFTRALSNSSQIKVFSDLPLIRETTIQEADGPFDWRVFAEGSLTELDEPVGDDLQTGGPLRYEETSRDLAYGVRKRFVTGTELELKQNIGDLDTNSIYFNPEEQARAGTYLTISQPLLKRFGIAYNRSALDLATIDYAIAQDEFRRNLESHLLEVSRAYWGLYLERALLVQKTKLAQRSRDILEQMESRAGMDVQPSLLARARSMTQAHELAAMQAEYALRNAQSRIRALVNDPQLLNAGGLELVTRQQPARTLLDIPFSEVIQATLEHRPEVAQALKHIQSAAIRLNNTRNELWPDLDLFFQTYVKGLEGDYEYGDAYSEQFEEGSPSYVAGLRFEYPLGNDGAQARNLRKKIEMRQLMRQLDTTVQNVLLEAQVSYRELIKNYRSMVQSYQVLTADEEEVKALMAQIDLTLSKNEPFGDVLYRLMDASERLTESEEKYAKGELSYNYATYNLYRAMGVLIQENNISTTRDEDQDELPVLQVSTPAAPGQ
ncbi:MAG: TolC family protein [Desulfobacterales bacterium]